MLAAFLLGGCSGDPRGSEATALMDEALSDDGPGCSFAAAHEGEVVWAHAKGLANETTGHAMDTSTRFNLASVGKQFTATAVLALVENRDLDLDDPVSALLAGLPGWADAVTVEQLVHHTSGLRDRPYARGEAVTRASMLDELATIDGMHQETTTFHYANSNYVLLSEIVATVTGTDFAAWASEHIFDEVDVELEVSPYARGGDIALGHDDLGLSAEDTVDWTGAGDVIGTPSELAAWADHYRDPQVISPATLATAIDAAVPVEGELPYGPGIWIWDDGTVGHEGLDVGTVSAFRIDPASGVALAGACNSAVSYPPELWDEVVEVWFGDQG